MKIVYTDALVVGGGLAGLRAAISARQMDLDAIVLSLIPVRRSHSAAAQGGMQASLANSVKSVGDNEDVHFMDTVKGSDWGCDQKVARMFVTTVPKAIREMAAWGVPWTRVRAGDKQGVINGEHVTITETADSEGYITARDFGGTKKWRTCYTSDATGHTMLFTMANQAAKLGVKVHDRKDMMSLIVEDNVCKGAVVRDLITGELIAYMAKGVLIATGGYGRIYRNTTNAVICDGAAAASALETGIVQLSNMEAVQFHPTPIVPSGILLTEGCRGDGGILRDVDGHRFMPDYEPEKKELASRDVVSRRIIEHIRKGKGVKGPYGDFVWLDITILGREHIEKNLREVRDICMDFNGIDPAVNYAPIRPMQHYSMGGIRVNHKGHSRLRGLFAAGEAACWDMHGFNRLGGNSLAEAVVAGMIIGDYFAHYCKETTLDVSTAAIQKEIDKQYNKLRAVIDREKGENVFAIKSEMRDIMEDNVGIFRDGKHLAHAVEELQKLYERAKNISISTKQMHNNPELEEAYRVPKMLKMAICVAYGASERTESRGAHSREDYPKRDDLNWLKRTLATWEDDSKSLPTLTYDPLNIMEMELAPGFRGYGAKGNIIEHPDSAKRQAEIDKITDEFAKAGKDRFELQEALMPFDLLPRFKAKNERLHIGDK